MVKMTSVPPHPLKTLALLAALAGGGAAQAQVQVTGPDEVRPLVVPGGPAPVVTKTYPADGATAPAGVIVLKITFDQPMAADAWAYGKTDAGAFPQCLAHPRLLNDNHSFALLCTLAPAQTYAMTINPDPRFANANGRSAKPFVLHFTAAAPETRDLATALGQAGLTDADAPVMDWNDTGQGVSQTPAPPPP